MRELASTGFMSNRGRQNVASFLTKVSRMGARRGTILNDHPLGRTTMYTWLIRCVLRLKDLMHDWRLGAEWFESMLIDHDVCSNYGMSANMRTMA